MRRLKGDSHAKVADYSDTKCLILWAYRDIYLSTGKIKVAVINKMLIFV